MYVKKNIAFLVLIIACFVACSPSRRYSRAELKKRTFNFFWETAHKQNFQIPDRYPSLTFSSIAATGFGLSSYLVGIDNHYITREQGAVRVLATLKALYNLPQSDKKSGASGYKGFYYHFLNLDDCMRFKTVELSSIDTGLLMAGVLSCMSYFDADTPIEKEIRSLSETMYTRVEWDWMTQEDVMSMGWHPETGFIKSKWQGYNEAMILLILAMGSPSHAISDKAWQKWCNTYQWDSFQSNTFIQFDPLFGHQYSHIWIDFRGMKDAYTRSHSIDYFENSKRATLANRAYCNQKQTMYPHYNDKCWGLTACDGPYNGEKNINGHLYSFFDYRARGACSYNIVDDGTIAPTAAGGSFPFTPKESEEALEYMWNTYGKNLVGKYGFKDAFNPLYKDNLHPKGWYDIDYLGIDQGPILLQIQNYETELLWKIMKKNPYVQAGLKKAGFTN